MKNKNLNITVSGQVCSGKSSLTLLLINLLRNEGFNVEYNGSIAMPTEDILNKSISKNQDTIIKYIKQNSKIIINEIQEKNINN